MSGNKEYLETDSFYHLGYLRLSSAVRPLFMSFGELRILFEKRLELDRLQTELKLSPDDMPVWIDLPARPKGDASFVEASFSLAQLAGAAVFAKIFYSKKPDREIIFFGRTSLAEKAVKRWFNTLPFEEDEVLAYKTGSELIEENNIEIKREEEERKTIITGNSFQIIISEEETEFLISEKTSPKDYHILIGFARLFSMRLYDFLAEIPTIKINGEAKSAKEIIAEWDQIISYV